jgi:hypothetical protein
MDAADAALVAALDAALRGEPAGPAPTSLTTIGKPLVAEVLHLAQWHDPERLAAVLAQLDVADAGDGAVGAVYSWLRTDEPRLAEHALAWLARRGTAAARAIDARGHWDRYGECVGLARSWVTEPARPTAIEATAWFLTWGAPRAELRELLGDGNTRWVARAHAAQIATAPDELAGAEGRLAELLQLPANEPVRLANGREWDQAQVAPFELAEPLRVLAAIALAERGHDLVDRDGLGALVEEHCTVPLAALGEHVRALRRGGDLAALLDALEADCRTRLGLRPALVWPHADAR